MSKYSRRCVASIHDLQSRKSDPANYTARYKDDGDLYGNLRYGSPYVSKGLRFAAWLNMDSRHKGKVLCVGVGEGYELVRYLKDGYDAYGTELHTVKVPYLKDRVINAEVPNLPFKDNEFGFLSCTEVLEHIAEADTDEFLTECKRVAKAFFFSIATKMDSYNSHINLHDVSWWYEKFVKAGFKIINIQFRPIIDVMLKPNLTARMWYNEGVMVLASKDI